MRKITVIDSYNTGWIGCLALLGGNVDIWANFIYESAVGINKNNVNLSKYYNINAFKSDSNC